MSFDLYAGQRVLVVGANGAGKSTMLSILGGTKMIPKGKCHILGREAFDDCSLQNDVMYKLANFIVIVQLEGNSHGDSQ